MPIWRGTTNSNWGTASNWAVDGSGNSGVPTAATDAIFDDLSPNCTVNITTAVCRNLNFNSGTGYTNTITMTNQISVGSGTVANHSVTLAAGMGIAGTGAINTRANGTTSLRSNGRVWPNAFGINNSGAFGTSNVALLDNWTISGNLFIGPGGASVVIFSGAFTINAGANVTLQITGTNGRIAATAGSISTIRMTGTGTYSSTGITNGGGLGLNLTIDAPGQTVTLANGSGYGGPGTVVGSTFLYVAGTVVSVGTFYLYGGIQTVPAYTLNLNGSSSTSATTTSSTGVNFNNLEIRTGGVSGAQTIIITGNICVVGNLTTTPTSITKAPLYTSGGTIYLNGNFTHNAGMRTTSSTVVVLQGTSVTYSEANASTAFIPWGTAWQVQINTTGSVNISTIIGFRDAGSLTYTAGTVTFSPGASILAGQSAAFYGFGSAGITIPAIEHNTGSPGVTFGTLLFFYDTVPFRVLTFNLTGATVNFTFTHKGTIGWDCDNLSCFLAPASTGSALRLLPLIEYKIRTSLIMLSWAAVPANGLAVISDPSTASTIFTLLPGASQDMFYISAGTGGGDVDSSNGQTIYTRGGFISTNTKNWKNWNNPVTRHSTFISN
jgi:hypothetical protein